MTEVLPSPVGSVQVVGIVPRSNDAASRCCQRMGERKFESRASNACANVVELFKCFPLKNQPSPSSSLANRASHWCHGIAAPQQASEISSVALIGNPNKVEGRLALELCKNSVLPTGCCQCWLLCRNQHRLCPCFDGFCIGRFPQANGMGTDLLPTLPPSPPPYNADSSGATHDHATAQVPSVR